MNPEIQRQLLEKMLHSGSLYWEFLKTVLDSGQADREADREGVYRRFADDCIQAYHDLVGKYLKAPQLGIYREALHRMMEAADAQHLFTAQTAEFMAKFSRPLENSIESLLRELEQDRDSENGPKSTTDIYDRISSLLDKEYDEYLKSPAGVQDVAGVIQSYVTYRERSDPARDLWLKSLSIPTRKEMEDVYKSIYDLKKRARKQDRRIAEQQSLIEHLTERVRSLEDRTGGKSSSGKAPAVSKVKRPTAKKQSAETRKAPPKKTVNKT